MVWRHGRLWIWWRTRRAYLALNAIVLAILLIVLWGLGLLP